MDAERRPGPPANPALITTAETRSTGPARPWRRPVAEVTAIAASVAGLVVLHDQGVPAGGAATIARREQGDHRADGGQQQHPGRSLPAPGARRPRDAGRPMAHGRIEPQTASCELAGWGGGRWV
jgi:hypothetical protein